ncbi:peptidoglycan DD-metalloendopeptidase family protein [Shewanella sp. 202IG2-18]|uniref:peptidoglycan DD-metalloendopeptidase family protein n=1 Tax=Parashewanella hymeniacidonis TaxID=2807618 RepID=UPI0019611597|nr:peptidoglycan DD-metalloendopeptidase family protein [Parashewanella hymeniacidonis]MBM7071942.1 peptidoglycan DD-metalloendopeptidase family protein [Parashewanella hymeniacidonis]
MVLMYFRCIFVFLTIFLIQGCSFSSHQAAPVESIKPYNPKHKKGSIKTSIYKVKKGETLYSIAWGAGKDFKKIAQLNRLKKPYTIYAGQWLRIKPRVVKKPKAANKKSTQIAKNIKAKTRKTDKNNQVAKNSSKKILDKKKQSAYSVTVSQQENNKAKAASSKISHNKVARWVWPSKGKIISKFSNKTQGNKGIKFSGRRGDAIKAAASGKVVYAGNALRGYGNLVIIKHSDDYLSAYAHTDKIIVKEQQQVRAGQKVATMGSSGANKVMLHFEIRYHGKSVDPLRYLPR